MATPNIAVLGMPKFLAGFLYGMTAENHLDELAHCYQGGHLMFEEVEFALSHLHTALGNDTLEGVLELAIVALQIPQTLHTCHGMGDDVIAFKEWASIFHNPAELIATVSKHVALHRKAIKADIAMAKAEWEIQ
jgi:hypothetical protein